MFVEGYINNSDLYHFITTRWRTEKLKAIEGQCLLEFLPQSLENEKLEAELTVERDAAAFIVKSAGVPPG